MKLPPAYRLMEDLATGTATHASISETYGAVYAGLPPEQRAEVVNHLAFHGFSSGVVAAIIGVSQPTAARLLRDSPSASAPRYVMGFDGAARDNIRHYGEPEQGRSPGRPVSPREDLLAAEVAKVEARLAVMPRPLPEGLAQRLANLGKTANPDNHAE